MRSWTRLITYFLLSSLTVQFCGFLAGLIWTWSMRIEDYAVFALCLSALSFGAVLSDMGVTPALAFFWRRCRQSGLDPDPYIAAGRRIRNRLMLAASTIAALALMSLLMKRAIVLESVLVCAGAVAGIIILQAQTGFLATILRLRDRIRALLAADALGAVVRLAVAALSLLVSYVTVTAGLLSQVLGAAITFAALHVAARHIVATRSPPAPSKEFMTYIMPTAPTALLYAFKDQILIWAAWFGGGTEPVAALSALGRFSLIFSVCGAFAATIAVPMLAQIGDNSVFARKAIVFALPILLASCALTAGSILAPDLFLMLLGPNYRGLQLELFWSLSAASMIAVAHYFAHVNRIRGWIRCEPVVSILHFITILTLVRVGDFSTPLGAIMTNVWLALFEIAAVLATTALGLTGSKVMKTRV